MVSNLNFFVLLLCLRKILQILWKPFVNICHLIFHHAGWMNQLGYDHLEGFMVTQVAWSWMSRCSRRATILILSPSPPPPPRSSHTLCIYIYFLNSVIFKGGGGGARWPCAARALNMIITLFSPGLITVMLSLLALLGFLIKLRVIGCSARCISQVPKSAHISFATSPLATNLQPDSIKKKWLLSASTSFLVQLSMPLWVASSLLSSLLPSLGHGYSFFCVPRMGRRILGERSFQNICLCSGTYFLSLSGIHLVSQNWKPISSPLHTDPLVLPIHHW